MASVIGAESPAVSGNQLLETYEWAIKIGVVRLPGDILSREHPSGKVMLLWGRQRMGTGSFGCPNTP
jgi:hypothetical protein